MCRGRLIGPITVPCFCLITWFLHQPSCPMLSPLSTRRQSSSPNTVVGIKGNCLFRGSSSTVGTVNIVHK